MALKRYGVLKGRPISRRLGSGSSPHYQVRIVDEAGTDYRVAVNVKSRLAPSELNQGNVGGFVQDDGVWQDGGLLFHFPGEGQWTAVFLKFQSQSWHTDDRTGHTLTVPGEDPDGLVRILAAMVNSKGSPEKEWVFLLNTSDRAIPLTGWELADKQKARLRLHGTLDGGAILKVDIKPPVALSNKGGTITLLNDRGLKVHGVSYTREQANQPGWTIVF